MSTNEISGRPLHSSPTIVPASMGMMERDMGEGFKNEMPNIGAAMWRYRWAVALPMMLGMMAGFLLFLRTPETYRSTTRLMVESDRPAMMDVLTGEMIGGVPSIDIVQSQLFSDEVITKAFQDPRMLPFQDQFEHGLESFVELVKTEEALELEPEVSDVKTAQSVVALLHFDSRDPELSQKAVICFSDALQSYYDSKYSNAYDEMQKFINSATDKIQPQLDAHETELMRFRQASNLDFDEKGNAINPHRVLNRELMTQKASLYNEYVDAKLVYDSIKQTVEASKDPKQAFLIVNQLLDNRMSLPASTGSAAVAMGADDNELAALEVESELAPLKAERDALAAEYSKGHPQVRQLDSRITSLERRLKELGSSKSQRIGQLMDDEERKTEQALEAVKSALQVANVKVSTLAQRLTALNQQINDEAKKARELSNKEVEHMALQRKVEATREMVTMVSEQMSKVDMASGSESETRVLKLTEAKGAYLVSPILWKLVGIGGFLGLAVGAGLAFLLEKNANTFRDPDEIAATLGLPVLTHVPFFKKTRNRRGKDSKESAYKELDPCLAVLHSPSSVVAESIRSLRTAVFFEMGSEDSKVIQVTSPLPGDGKSTIAGNLACAIAQSGKSVLAIDCDLRRPQFTDNFVLQDQLGLTNVLNGECEWREACHSTPLMHLDVMPSGPIPANPAEALTLPDMAETMETLRQHYDYIIVDTPPLLVVTDPSILASMVDGVLVTLRVRRKSKLNAKEAVNILGSVGANVIGTVINNSDEASSSDGYRGYGYYRYSRYAKKYYRRGIKTNEVVPKGSKKRSGMTVSGRTMTDVRPASPAALESDLLVSSSAAQPTKPGAPTPKLESDSNEA